jgi:Domain of unknown function (DUF4145)
MRGGEPDDGPEYNPGQEQLLMLPYKPPVYQAAGFNCPQCYAFAKHNWIIVYMQQNGVWTRIPNLQLAECDHCHRYSIWLDQNMVFPDISTAPLANPDLPKEVKADYDEARGILTKSPRGAAALLRLAVQKFCKNLGERGTNLNDDIAELVKKGLPVRVQQALDSVRVIGNNAVHPGQIDITDDPVTAARLFELVNIVCDYMITQPKRVEEIYGKLPLTQKDAIKERDGV